MRTNKLRANHPVKTTRCLADGWRAKPKRRKRKRRKKASTGAASVNLMVHARERETSI